jgi:hypothetical protein
VGVTDAGDRDHVDSVVEVPVPAAGLLVTVRLPKDTSIGAVPTGLFTGA